MKTRSRIHMTLTGLAATALLLSPVAQASEPLNVAGMSLFAREGKALQSRRIIPFLNLGIGYANMATDENPESLTGSQFRIGALGSYRADRWIGDLGAGWFRNSVSGSSPVYARASILTRAGYAEAAARYRLNDQWSIGPAIETMFGPDISYSFASSPKSFMILGGAQAVYEVPKESVDLRFLARLSTDITLPERTLTTVMFGLQIGIPWTDHGSASRSGRRAGAVVPSVSYFAPLDQVNFPVASAELSADAEAFLEMVAHAFIEESDSWDTIDIGGHCDERGSYEFNQRLSEQRARAVARILTRAGIPAQRLALQGFSYTQPEDARSLPEAWAKNRRVELKVHGDLDAMSALGEKLKTYRFETGSVEAD